MYLLASSVATTGYWLWAAEQGRGAAHPEEVFLADRQRQVLGPVWAVVFGACVVLR